VDAKAINAKAAKATEEKDADVKAIDANDLK
jgi:hypothetical protein